MLLPVIPAKFPNDTRKVGKRWSGKGPMCMSMKSIRVSISGIKLKNCPAGRKSEIAKRPGGDPGLSAVIRED
jgi:hypothetical protein